MPLLDPEAEKQEAPVWTLELRNKVCRERRGLPRDGDKELEQTVLVRTRDRGSSVVP